MEGFVAQCLGGKKHPGQAWVQTSFHEKREQGFLEESRLGAEVPDGSIGLKVQLLPYPAHRIY